MGKKEGQNLMAITPSTSTFLLPCFLLSVAYLAVHASHLQPFLLLTSPLMNKLYKRKIKQRSLCYNFCIIEDYTVQNILKVLDILVWVARRNYEGAKRNGHQNIIIGLYSIRIYFICLLPALLWSYSMVLSCTSMVIVK